MEKRILVDELTYNQIFAALKPCASGLEGKITTVAIPGKAGHDLSLEGHIITLRNREKK